MADDNDNEVLDLSAGGRSVRIPGSDEVVPVEQLMSKNVLLEKTRELAAQRQQMEAAYAPAAQLFQALQEDPVGFYQELGERMGMSPQAAAEAGTQIQQLAEDQGMNMNDPRFQQAVQAQMAPLLAELDGVKKFMMNKSARDSIAAEISEIRQLDPELTQGQMTEVVQLASQMRLPDMRTAYRVWDHSRLIGKTKKLEDELEVTKRKAMFPELGGSSERGITRQTPRGKPDDVLRDMLDANARKLGLA